MTPVDHKDLVDLLVAATLVSATLAVLFVLWQADVAAALVLKSSDDSDNDEAARKVIRGVLYGRSTPMFVIGVMTFAVLLHQSVPIVWEALHFPIHSPFDDIKILYILNTVMVGMLAWGLASQTWSLAGNYRRHGGCAWLRTKPAVVIPGVNDEAGHRPA
jgi:hypothetical protein